ncbi:T9SS type A sorting domain-containing protein [Neolewinella agarilytica]|uniref:Por secretion system C-terminal sorting domain-containing protein n=1 Tax=Neolewinella agarilytica TaxID=478744 RepID=A0A1H8ZFJ4_9BACT|nr:T9SS type A sorting domain-containing protein [Neolewinella agarilytica]SEP63146.1 Por secretion system C-terminal sorting domain-containing protein [Neolewinella agarilytica]
MKLVRLLFLLCLLAFLCTSGRAQCPAGNVVLETDAEVAAFFATYPDCTEFNGDLNIQNNVTDLIPFKDVVYVAGDLTIRSTPIDNLEGLAQLQVVDGSFGLSDLDFTSDLASVALSLETVGNQFLIRNHPGLKTINVLDNVESAGSLVISDNPNLENLDGLANVAVSTALTIADNAVLSDCAASGICAAITAPVASLTISGNTGNCANFFEAQAACLGNPDCPTNLTLTTNQEIADFVAAYPNCVNLPGDLLVEDDANNLQALDLVTVGGNAIYRDISSLQNIDGFGLVSVGGDLLFQRLHNLESTMANGFLPLETVGGKLVLASLTGVNFVPFNSVTSLGGISISFTSEVYDLSAMAGAELNGSISITGCSTIETLDFLSPFDKEGNVFNTLLILNNPLLEDISEVDDIVIVGPFINFQGNTNLSECSISSICTAILDPAILLPLNAFTNNATGCNSEAEIKAECASELAPLLAFYNAAGGPNWTNNTGWAAGAAGTNCTPCDGTWFGISCTDGQVTEIRTFGNNNLVGTIAPEIGQLTGLRTISITLNPDLTGPIPAEIFDLPNLEGLSLFTNNLTGSIPTNVGNATQLIGLNLNSNSLLEGTIPASIINLVNLELLGLSGNEITGNLPLGMQAMVKLRSIEISNTNVTGAIPAELLTIPALESLNLQNNNMNGLLPGTFDDNGVLNRLLLGENNFIGPFQVSIAATTTLRFLRLDGNNLTGLVTTNVSNLVNLEEFNISDNDFAGPLPVLNAPDLTEYRAAGNSFDGPLPAFLGNLSSLSELFLNDNALTGCYPAAYSSLCSGVTTNFSGNDGLPLGGSAASFQTEFCSNGNPCGTICPEEDVMIGSQADADEFLQNYPNCVNLPASLNIVDAADLLTLSPFFNLESVESLMLQNLAGVRSLTPFFNLTTIGSGSGEAATGSLIIDNLSVTSLDGLDNVVGDLQNLAIDNNNLLTDISALGPPSGGRLASGGSVVNMQMENNTALANLSGLEDKTVLDELIVSGNTDLSDCAIESFCNAVADPSVSTSFANNGFDCSSNAEVEAACSLLPLSWKSFVATPDGKTVRLDWVTVEEINNEKFLVERSADARNWASIGEIMADSGSGENTYTLLDESPLPGSNYYRIRQVDFNGTFSFSEVLLVDVAFGQERAYPNPFSGALTVYSAVADEVQVLDLQGREVARFQHLGDGAQVQNLDLKSGVYTLRMLASGAVLRVVAR